MSSPVLRGVFPVFQTPFDDAESILFDQLEAEIAWIAAQGAHGIVFGMVSEALRLSDAERRDVVRAAGQAASGLSLPLIVSVGAESTHVALERIESAVDAGASAVMATAPLASAHSEHQLETYFRTLLTRSPVPVVVQDASAYVGEPLSIALQVRLWEEFGPRVKFKPESLPVVPVVRELVAATGGGAEVFEGMGGASLRATYAVGGIGSMPGAEVCWAVVALWRALECGDAVQTERIGEPLSRLAEFEEGLDSFVVCEKFLLAEQGVLRARTSRLPVSFALDESDRAALLLLLADLRDAIDPTRSAVESAYTGIGKE